MHKKELVPKMHNAPPPPPRPIKQYSIGDKTLMIRELNVRLEEIGREISITDKFHNQLHSLTVSNRKRYDKLCKRTSDTMKFRDQLIKELEDERISE